MATSTGSRALDFALGIGAYAPQIEEPEMPQEGGIASALPAPHRTGKLSPHAKDFEPLIQRAAQQYNIPPDLLRSLIQRESSFDPTAVSSAGAMGLSQLMPGTAAQYGVKNVYDPEQNVMGGAHYLSDMLRRYNNDPQLALAAYNSGPGNVDKYLKRGVPLPEETQKYVPAIMGNAGQQQMPAVPASQPVAEGMRVVTLTNGRELEVPAEMTDAQVLEQIRKSPSPEMSRLMPAREATIGGKSALVPFNMADDEAMHHLVNQGDIPDPMAGKGGRGWNNLVSGFETSIGNMLTGLGKPEEAQRFYEAAKAGEYNMYESEVEAAKQKGLIPGLYAEAQQNLIYPGMEMLGQFAPAMMPGPAALKVGAMYPAARGEILHRAKEEGKEVSEADASLYGLPLAVVETLGPPIKGAGKLLGREAEEAAIKGMVERGAVEEAEQAALGSRAADLAKAYGTNVAKNVATMGAMEGIQRGAMGESMLPQSMEDVTSLLEPAAWFSLPHGAIEGLGARGAREEALARESAQREPVQIPERRPEVVEPEAVSEPEVTPPETRTELQNIGELYGRHMMEAEARGEPPMSPEEFMAQYKPEPMVQEEIKDELAPGDIEAAPSSQIIQPSPFVRRKVEERKNAQQEPSAGPIDGGSRAQPEVREESGDQTVGGAGVESGGQGVEAPQVSDVKAWQPSEADLAQRQADLKAHRDRISKGEEPLTPEDQATYQGFLDAGDKESAFNFYKHKTGKTPFVLKPAERRPAPTGKEKAPVQGGAAVKETIAPLKERDFTPEEVDRIRAMQDEGVGHRDIAKKLKLPYYDYLTKAGRVQAGKGDLGGVIKPNTMKEGEYATRNELDRMPERDRIGYLQLMGNSKEEIGERLKLSEEEVTNKLKEYGLPDTESQLERKMSEEREKYLEAQREERAKYREAGAAPEGVEFENIPHTAESPFKWEVEGKRLEEGESPIVDIDGRKIVKARINGKSVPFYLSKRGTSGKAAGKWYPFFGYKDGWFNKGDSLEQIHGYYGSEKLKEVAQHLDEKYGDIRKESHPSADWSKTAIESINEGLEPVSYEEAAPGHVEAALKRLGLGEAEKPFVSRPDYWRENPDRPEDTRSWQSKNGDIHYDLGYTLPSGSKIRELHDQRRDGVASLVIDTPEGEKHFWFGIDAPRSSDPSAPGRIYWRQVINGEPVTEKSLRKTFGDDLYDVLYKHEGEKVVTQDDITKVVHTITDDIRSLGKKKAPKKKLNIDELEVEQREKEKAAKEKAAAETEAERQKQEELEAKEDEQADEMVSYDDLIDAEFDYTEPDRKLDYSKGEAAKEAHTPESLTKHIADTYGARKPAVNLTTREAAGVDKTVKAFYDPKTKKVHLIADNIAKGTNVHGLLKHEIGVHAQKLGLKDPEFQGILKHMQSMRDKGIQAVREAYAKVPEGTRPERLHEEALGYLVEHHPHLPLVRRFISWLRRMAHKLTGNAGWLKPEDLSHMAHRILKKDYGVESRPERRDVQGEKLRSVKDDNLRAIRAAGITKTEKQLTYKETAQEFTKLAKTAYGKRRGEYIDVTDPLTQALQKLDRFDKNLGKMRADLIAAEANQSVGLVAHALENGIPVINKSGSMMVTPGANLKHAVEFARSKEKGGEELLSYVLRVNIGEHRLKEHAQDIQDLKRLAREMLELKGAVKFHDKLNQGKERKLAEKALASKESAYKTIIRERNIDPETMEGREKLVDANMIALRDKLMKDHPWLKEATQEVYDSMDGLVDFQYQAGMIDKLTADKWKAAPYVPLYKALEDLEKDPTFSKLFPRSAESVSQVKQIKGFKHSVNMLENLHKHYYGMMLPAVFNHVRRESMNQMLHLDALSRVADNPGLSYEKALRKATEAAETKHAGPSTMKVLDNGEERHYKVQDPDLLQMFAFNRPEMSGFVNAMRPVTALQRTAFLKNPAFWGTQLFLDPLYANLTAGAKSLIHPGQAVVNLMKIWAGKSEGAKALERHGVDIGYQAYAGKKSLSYAQTGEATQFHELFGKRSRFRSLMNMLDRVHNSVDEATRVSVYNAVKKDGKKLGLTGQNLEDYAVQRARTYMNFSARGRNQLLNEYRAVTAFTSAAINGADALMKNYKGYGLNEKEGAEIRRIFRTRLMAGMAAGMGLTLAQLNASNGKQDGDLFEQLTSIDTGLGFKLPFKWDVGALILGLPKVFVMTTMLDATNPNSLTLNQGVKAAWELVRKNMLPPIHLPDAINPLVEATFNFSTDEWDAIESAGAMRYSADARGRSNTFLGEFFGNLLGVSGKKADFVGRSYVGKFYDYVNAVADEFTGRMEGMPGADKKLEKAIIGPFYKDEDRVSGADRIYDADLRAGQEVATFNKFRDSNKEKFAEFKNDPERMAYRRAAPALRNARERLSAYEKQISQIMDSKLPKAAKETRIRQINEQKRKAIEQGNATVKRLLGDYAP